jgi:hypothetical protein
MARRTALPFPRGTFSDDGGLVTVGDDVHKEWEGKEFEVEDTVHGFAQPVTLRVVKNDSGGDITVARKCYKYSQGSQGDIGARIAGLAGDGEVGHPIDDKYAVDQTWPEDALGYVVVEGRCDVLTDTTANDLAVGIAVQIANGGVLADKAEPDAGAFVLGTLDKESSYAGSTAACVIVGKKLALANA